MAGRHRAHLKKLAKEEAETNNGDVPSLKMIVKLSTPDQPVENPDMNKLDHKKDPIKLETANIDKIDENILFAETDGLVSTGFYESDTKNGTSQDIEGACQCDKAHNFKMKKSVCESTHTKHKKKGSFMHESAGMSLVQMTMITSATADAAKIIVEKKVSSDAAEASLAKPEEDFFVKSKKMIMIHSATADATNIIVEKKVSSDAAEAFLDKPDEDFFVQNEKMTIICSYTADAAKIIVEKKGSLDAAEASLAKSEEASLDQNEKLIMIHSATADAANIIVEKKVSSDAAEATLAKPEEDDFVLVSYKRHKIAFAVPHVPNIIHGILPQEETQKNMYETLCRVDDVDDRDREDEDARTPPALVGNNHGSDTVQAQRSLKKLKTTTTRRSGADVDVNFSTIVESMRVEDAMNKDRINDNHSVPKVIKKEIQDKALQFLAPIFWNFKNVCDSGLPCAGFRCGPGGSVPNRRPFLSGRLEARIKKLAKEEAANRRNGDDYPSQSMISHETIYSLCRDDDERSSKKLKTAIHSSGVDEDIVNSSGQADDNPIMVKTNPRGVLNSVSVAINTRSIEHVVDYDVHINEVKARSPVLGDSMKIDSVPYDQNVDTRPTCAKPSMDATQSDSLIHAAVSIERGELTDPPSAAIPTANLNFNSTHQDETPIVMISTDPNEAAIGCAAEHVLDGSRVRRSRLNRSTTSILLPSSVIREKNVRRVIPRIFVLTLVRLLMLLCCLVSVNASKFRPNKNVTSLNSSSTNTNSVDLDKLLQLSDERNVSSETLNSISDRKLATSPMKNPTQKPSARPIKGPTKKPTKKPTIRPIPVKKPSKKPSARPSKRTSKKPSARPTIMPTARSTTKPTSQPTSKPTYLPTAKPTARPTAKPTARPTAKPTPKPTAKPTARPTAKPTPKPTAKTAARPTAKPTPKPTAKPTARPTAKPTPKPTAKPAARPTAKPTPKPTAKPAARPTAKPTPKPLKPTIKPTNMPSPYKGGTFTCPSGSTIIRFSGLDGWWVNQIQGTCDDGTVLGPVGGSTGTAVLSSPDCTSGYSGWTLIYGTYVGKMTPHCNGIDGTSIGAGLGLGSGNTVSSECPLNQIITGFSAQAMSGFVASFSLICGGGGKYVCPYGSRIISFSGRSGSWINQIQGICSDGTILGPVGADAPSLPFVEGNCTSGYSGGTLIYGAYTGKLTPSCDGIDGTPILGAGLSAGSGNTLTFNCPLNQVITGFAAKAKFGFNPGDSVGDFSFICGGKPVIISGSSLPLLKYGNGRLIRNVKVVTVWWGGADKVAYTSQLEQFYKAIVNSDWFSQFSEYSTSTYTIGPGSWLKSYSDTSAPLGQITDSMIKTRLLKLFQEYSLPVPDGNTYYSIHVAKDVGVTQSGGDKYCTVWCGYHYYVGYNWNLAYYGVIPDNSNCGGCNGGLFGSTLNALYSTVSHELGEAVTDPVPGGGWYDYTKNADGSERGENGDICNTRVDKVTGSDGNKYTVQKMWSNKQNACYPCWEAGSVCGIGSTCDECCGNKYTYWYGKAFTACGTEPCWNDGSLCGLGTSCNACCNTSSYWYGKAFTACGKEPCWSDGSTCALGTTCNACCNTAHWWDSKLITACGTEPCWNDGSLCAAGTTCKNCCHASSYWYSKALTACGKEPCWSDGSTCALGTTCNACCNTAHWWDSKFITACGTDPCWNDGSLCAAGTTCKNCCHASSYWYGKAFTACGNEPCWSDGSICAAGTTCNSCCNGSSYWYSKAITACGTEPCWGSKTTCGAGTTCDACCNGYSWQLSCFFTCCN